MKLSFGEVIEQVRAVLVVCVPWVRDEYRRCRESKSVLRTVGEFQGLCTKAVNRCRALQKNKK
jgi:hypothetical protein